MNGVLLVEDTHSKLRSLIDHESRGPGDADNALRRVARHLDVPYSYLWRVLYRKRVLKSIDGLALLNINFAHEAMLDARRSAEAKTDQTSRIGALLTRVARSIAGDVAGAEEGGVEDGET